MYLAHWTMERGWDGGKLVPYGPLLMMPSAQVLNYGQVRQTRGAWTAIW